MTKYHISQFGKPTIRYSFKEAMKVMHDRKLTKGDKALLRIHCDSIEDADKIIKDKLFIESCTHLFANYGSHKLFWFVSNNKGQWVEFNRIFSDDISSIENFFDTQNLRDKKLKEIGL